MKRTDLESFKKSMKEANVQLTVFFAGVAAIMEAPKSESGLLETNRRLSKLCRSEPDRFMFYLLVHPSKISESIDVIEEYYDDPNVMGVGEILPKGHFNGHEFNTVALQQIAECAAKHHLPMNFHTGTIESVRQCEWLINQVPSGQYILAHAAGEAVNEGLTLMDKHPNILMDLSVHAWKPGIKEPLLKRADRSRLLFGSDFPIESQSRAIEQFYQMGFAPQEIENIARLNALKLLPKLNRILSQLTPNAESSTPANGQNDHR